MSETVIGIDRVMGIADAIVADKPEGYGYADLIKEVTGENYVEQGCVNWSLFGGTEKVPACIVGQIVAKLGYLDDISAGGAWALSVYTLSGKGVKFTEDAIRALRTMQLMQDGGASWKTSVMAARVNVISDCSNRKILELAAK